MNTTSFKIGVAMIMLGAILLAFNISSQAQVASPGAPADIDTSVPPSMDPAAAKIWTSPQMLKARQWLADYCSHSAKVTPQMAKQYMSELEGMSPSQMQLWLLKFEHEEEQQQQQYAAWQKMHEAGLRHALAVQQAVQQSYSNINRDITEAAQTEQGQLERQQQQAAQMQEDKMQELNTPGLLAPDAVGPYGVGYGGWGGYGGMHYHIHVGGPAPE